MTLELCCDSEGRDSSEVLELARLNSALQTGIQSPLDDAIRPQLAAAAMPQARRDPLRLRAAQALGRRRAGRRPLLIVKGAPARCCRCAASSRKRRDRFPAGSSERERAEALHRRLSERGWRVLAVASRGVAASDAYSTRDEEELTLAGFLAFSDPVLPDAARNGGRASPRRRRIQILTGDDERVARDVAAQVGLDDGGLVLGSDLDAMTDSALGAVAERTSVFARITPAQKNRILLALKRRGHVVGFLGDGINDAPSLHAADVGISVASAVDVAREAAEIILLEKSLRSLHSGILEGRRSFGNVMKYLLMETSSNFGNMFSLALASLFLPFLPMLPTQILLNNFLYDLAQMTIPTDRVDSGYARSRRAGTSASSAASCS